MTSNKYLLKKVQNFINTSLSTWSNRGFDLTSVDFVEGLNFKAVPLYRLPRRGRVQARQILTLSMANKMGDDKKNIYLDLAQKVVNCGLSKYLTKDGALISCIYNKNEKDSRCFFYDQTFLLLAYAWLYAATKDKIYVQKAENVWKWLEGNLSHHKNGFNVCFPYAEYDQLLEQNPHMHLFEACLVSAEYFDSKNWIARADNLFGLFEKCFYHREKKALLEFFNQNWQQHDTKGNVIEPGHHFEWVWLLSEYQRLSGVDTGSYQKELFKTGCNYGLNHIGLGVNELSLETMEVVRSSTRLWVECELLKAYIATRMFDKADHLVEKIFAYYLIEDKGIWYEELDNRQQNIARYSPATSLYHLYTAFNEYMKSNS
jgi:mannose-6-phosphate isomerase